MKKEKSAFNELLAKYNEFAERKANKMNELEENKEKADAELEEIQQKIKKDFVTMPAEEYRAKTDRVKELTSDLLTYQEQAEIIETTPGTTDEEYKAWTGDLEKERDRIKTEIQDGTYKLLRQFVEFYEKEITEYEKLRSLRYSFEGAVGNRTEPIYTVKNLPPYVRCICRVLLIYYNELEELINNGEHKTTCVDMDEIKRAFHEISETGNKAEYPQTKELNVPTWEEAYNEIKYNKPWPV